MCFWVDIGWFDSAAKPLHGVGAVRVPNTAAPVVGAVSSEVATMIAVFNFFHPSSPVSDRVQSDFLALVPRFKSFAQYYFRYVPCPFAKDDKVAETLALAWSWFV